MTSTVEVRTDLTELAHRLRTVAQALKHPSAHHALSSDDRAALCKEVQTIAAELRRDWRIDAFADWRACMKPASTERFPAEDQMPSCPAYDALLVE